MKKTYPIIKLKWRFLWTECDKCHDAFRFEDMWNVDRGVYDYCTECFKTKEEVLAYINLSSESVHSHFLKLDPLNQPQEYGVSGKDSPTTLCSDYWFDALGLPHFDFSKTIPMPEVKTPKSTSEKIQQLSKSDVFEALFDKFFNGGINLHRMVYPDDTDKDYIIDEYDNKLETDADFLKRCNEAIKKLNPAPRTEPLAVVYKDKKPRPAICKNRRGIMIKDGKFSEDA